MHRKRILVKKTSKEKHSSINKIGINLIKCQLSIQKKESTGIERWKKHKIKKKGTFIKIKNFPQKNLMKN